MKIWCFDCTNRKFSGFEPYITTDSLMKPYYEALSKFDTRYRCGHWNPEYWVQEHGFVRNWGDAAVRTKDFEILRKEADGKVEFMIICPKMLRRPVHLGNGWGSY